MRPVVELWDTPDNSGTRLLLNVQPPDAGPAAVELDVREVTLLAQALLRWLADNKHPVPGIPETLSSSLPPWQAIVLPEHRR